MIFFSAIYDFRSKLFVFALAFVLAAFLVHDFSVCLALFFLMFYLLFQGFTEAGLFFFGTGTVIALLRLLSGSSNLGIFVPDVFLYAVLRILLVTAAAHSLVRTPPGEVTAALMKWRLPKTAALPVIFILRFTPTINSEFRRVFDAMRLRKLINPAHPYRTLEYLIVPMIVRSSKVADELAASAELRGISFPGTHSTLRIIRFTWKDWLLMTLALLLMLLCLLIDRRVIA